MRTGRLLALCTLCALMVSTALAINPGTDVVVAAAGAAPGAPPSYWTTDLLLFNPGTSPAAVAVSYLPRGSDNSNPDIVPLTVNGGETVIRANVVFTDFGVESFGALRIVSDAQIVVSSVTNNLPGGGKAEAGSYGQGFPGIPVSSAVVAGSTTHIAGLSQSDIERSNFGVVDVSGQGSRVRVALLPISGGGELAAREYSLQPWEPRQANATDLGIDSFEAGTLQVETLEGAVLAYASRINNDSGDASTLEMYWSSGGRDAPDGRYHYLTTADDGDLTGGGWVQVSGGQVTELCGNSLFFDKTPACGYWLPYCLEEARTLAELVDGVQFTVTYTNTDNAAIGLITWEVVLDLTDNLVVSGTVAAVGSGWIPSRDGCNGVFPTVSLVGGIQ